MVVIAVALASCLIVLIVMALSTRQIENHVEDTYEAVYTRIAEDVHPEEGLDDFSRVGEYYMLAMEPAKQGCASYILL